MAFIGMLRPVYSKITTYTEGSAITYGTGAVISKARSASISYEHEDNPFYGDDVIVENDQGLNGYTIDLETTDLPIDIRCDLLGETALTTTSDNVTTTIGYRATDAQPPYVGFGFVRVLMVGGSKKYEGFWFHRLQFAMESEEANTKEKSISWGAPKIHGTGVGVYLDSSGAVSWYDHMEFTSLSAAETWLYGKANISTTSSGTGT